MVLTGQRTLSSLTYNYSKLLSAYGVQVITDDVVEIDPVGVKVRLGSGTILSADRIVLAPGVDFDTVLVWEIQTACPTPGEGLLPRPPCWPVSWSP